MADKLLDSYINTLADNSNIDDCDSCNKCETVSFSDVVGACTLDNGGYFGKLLTLATKHIESAKDKGYFTEETAGQVFAQALVASMQQAIQFELSHGKAQKEICLIDAQSRHEYNKIALEDAQIAKIKCDCENSKNVMGAQADLYRVQAKGFADNARQKMFDTQTQAFAMIYDSLDGDVDLPASLAEDAIDSTYGAIKDHVIDE